MPMAEFQRGELPMGGRVTRTPQSGELVRARKLRQALQGGASPTFIPPGNPSPVVQPSSLSWSFEKTIEKTISEKKNSAEKNPRKISHEEILTTRRHYLEQIFQNSPDPVILTNASFRTQRPNQEFHRMFGYSTPETLRPSTPDLLFPPDRPTASPPPAQCLH